jgi:hypothetical protein
MAETLYDTDALAWSETQAALLRRLARGERVNASIDWDNVIDEVETVGRSELRAVRSLLEQAILHILKAHAWPAHRDAPHWRTEAAVFLREAAGDYGPSMARHIDFAELYLRARMRLRPLARDFGEPAPVPPENPFALPDLLARDPDLLLERLRALAAD